MNKFTGPCYLLAFCLYGLAGAAGAADRVPYPADVVQKVTEDADWILNARLPDGAICWYTDKKRISPYLASFAAWGLVRASEVTGKKAYADAAFDWLNWYSAHEGKDGIVTDYDVTHKNGIDTDFDAANLVETSTGDEDSTDAYAGMFLVAAREWYHWRGDRAGLQTLSPGIDGALRTIRLTLQPDGLTWAKPKYHVKYLMDNAETYAGLAAAADLLRAFGNLAGSETAARDAQRMKQGVGSLWNKAAGSHDFARFENNAEQTSKWEVLYPDATSQVWPAALGDWPQTEAPLDSTHTKALVTAFLEHWPQWDQPTATTTVDSKIVPVGYWPAVCLALAAVGRKPEALAGAAHIREAAVAANRAWPFTPGIAGELILAESL